MDKKFLFRLLAIASNFIWEMIVAIAIGYFIGRGVDSLFDFERLFVIVFMVVGALAAVINFMRRVYSLGGKNNE